MPVASRMLARIVAVAVLATCAREAANAQSRQDTSIAHAMRSWGLLGTWATDCSQPASLANSYLSFHVGDRGSVLHRRDFGDGREVYEVQAATITRDGLIEVIVDFKALGGRRRWALAKGADGRIRAMANSKADGTDPSIRDGRFVGSGIQASWQTRCPDEMMSGSPFLAWRRIVQRQR